jgi:hypothetical protein
LEVKVDQLTNKPPPDVKQKVVKTTIEKIKNKDGVIGTLKLRPDSLTPLGE